MKNKLCFKDEGMGHDGVAFIQAHYIVGQIRAKDWKPKAKT